MHTISAKHGVHSHQHSGFHPVNWLVKALATRTQRARLDTLDDHLLMDIGIDRMMAHEEATRPFWDIH